jgi:hypothetical protein
MNDHQPLTGNRHLHLGAIQKIRDTQGGSTKCHMNFFALLSSDFNTFGK